MTPLIAFLAPSERVEICGDQILRDLNGTYKAGDQPLNYVNHSPDLDQASSPSSSGSTDLARTTILYLYFPQLNPELPVVDRLRGSVSIQNRSSVVGLVVWMAIIRVFSGKQESIMLFFPPNVPLGVMDAKEIIPPPIAEYLNALATKLIISAWSLYALFPTSLSGSISKMSCLN
ncbi:uncharacterized protein EI90DRAFT_3017126 [Cantharellus anzutake]|uniref:uncharacterized protein n=1 Tax=Cantharellus anzutake TaxID=1750568 RepID=UPI0019056906|nr:uncharacterized protein EI90DRAFT_3017126 [Cantharellus anzutake]KAF8329834.1 hypothetical protein EI90DRAFT_3017126 [Cantharellus anzutake]